LTDIGAAESILTFANGSFDERLQTRSFSLMKVLSTEQRSTSTTEARASWYFGEEDFLD